MSHPPYNTGPAPAPREAAELIEACFIPLDPVLDAFHGVLVELYKRSAGTSTPDGAPGKRYVVVQSAALTGNVLTRITSADEATARRVYVDLCDTGVYPATRPFQ